MEEEKVKSLFMDAKNNNIPLSCYNLIKEYLKNSVINCAMGIEHFDKLRLVFYIADSLDNTKKINVIGKNTNKGVVHSNIKLFKTNFRHCMVSYFTKKACEDLKNIMKEYDLDQNRLKEHIKYTILEEYFKGDKINDYDSYQFLHYYFPGNDVYEQYIFESTTFFPYYIRAYQVLYPEDKDIIHYILEKKLDLNKKPWYAFWKKY